MARSSLQLLAMVAVLAFGIMFGVDAASHGIEQVRGDAETQSGERIGMFAEAIATPPAPEVSPSAAPLMARDFTLTSGKTTASLPDRIADKFGGLLQITADHLVDFVVSVLDKVFA
ncbi:MAG TPA: DUF3679 domain-containing protein [Bacilli bacterium]